MPQCYRIELGVLSDAQEFIRDSMRCYFLPAGIVSLKKDCREPQAISSYAQLKVHDQIEFVVFSAGLDLGLKSEDRFELNIRFEAGVRNGRRSPFSTSVIASSNYSIREGYDSMIFRNVQNQSIHFQFSGPEGLQLANRGRYLVGYTLYDNRLRKVYRHDPEWIIESGGGTWQDGDGTQNQPSDP